MPVLFLSSLVFALGHVIVAYRTSRWARRKLLIHHIDPESILAYKNAFSGCTRFHGLLHHTVESFLQGVRVRQREKHLSRTIVICQSVFLLRVIACSLLARGSLYTMKFLIQQPAYLHPLTPFQRKTHHVISSSISPTRQRHESLPSASSNTRRLLNRRLSHQYNHTPFVPNYKSL